MPQHFRIDGGLERVRSDMMSDDTSTDKQSHVKYTAEWASRHHTHPVSVAQPLEVPIELKDDVTVILGSKHKLQHTQSEELQEPQQAPYPITGPLWMDSSTGEGVNPDIMNNQVWKHSTDPTFAIESDSDYDSDSPAPETTKYPFTALVGDASTDVKYGDYQNGHASATPEPLHAIRGQHSSPKQVDTERVPHTQAFLLSSGMYGQTITA